MQRIAVIGLGNIAKRHRKNIRALFPNAKILALSSSGRVPEEDISDCDEIVTDGNALLGHNILFAIVASPAPFHTEHALPLISAGVPVLIEKPVATALSDVDALLQAEQFYQTPVAVAYCLRYLPSAIHMQRLIVENAIGKIYNVHISVGQYLPDWRPDSDYRQGVSANAHLGGGALFELSHELDYARWLFGNLKIHSSILGSSQELSLHVEDCVDVLAISESGAVASIHLDFLQQAAHRACRVIGPQGALEWDLINNSITLVNKKGIDTLYSEPEFDKNLMYLEMLKDFINKVHGKPHCCNSLEDAKKTLQLVHGIKAKAGINNEQERGQLS